LISYSDAEHASDKIERKTTSGSCHIIGGNLGTWIRKKQGSIALSTIEAKYISTTSCCTQLMDKESIRGLQYRQRKHPHLLQ